MTITGPWERLVSLLVERSVRWGRFTLASGRESDLYVDARQTTLHPEGAALVADLVLDRLRPEVVAVGGPVTGADPIAGAVAAISWVRGSPVHAFMVRKEPKAHGRRLWVEGRENLPDGAPVCVIEDTATTGRSLLDAIGRVVESGLHPVQVVVVVDREEGAAEALARAGYTLEALVRRSDLDGGPR